MDAIEAAARAMYRYHNLREASNDAWRLYENEASAAIAAYRDAEIADLRAKLAEAEHANKHAEGLIRACERDYKARLEAAEHDAERYRWLRNESLRCPDTNTPTVIATCDPDARMIDGLALDNAVDAAIDSARGGER